MKFNFKSIKLLALGAVAVLTFSCGDDDVMEADLEAYQGNATVKGTVYINSDATMDDETALERAEGVTVRVTYNAGDLNVIGGGDNSETVVLTTTTSSTGEYSISLPATNDGVGYSISLDEYTAERTTDEFIVVEGVSLNRDEIKTHIWNADAQAANPLIGETQTVDFTLAFGVELNQDI